MAVSRFQHSISLTETQEKELIALNQHKIGLTEVFRTGLAIKLAEFKIEVNTKTEG